MRIAMIGVGYVGLTTAACFAKQGHQVVCLDNNDAHIKALQAGQLPIHEPKLHDLLLDGNKTKNLTFTVNPKDITDCQVVFLAVGTPGNSKDGTPDLSFLMQALRDILPYISPNTVLVIKSTVPVGTGHAVQALCRSQRADIPLSVVSNPEFLREGTAVRDFMSPDRIVIGSEDEASTRVMQQLYKAQREAKVPFLVMPRKSAELSKYAANSFLTVKLAFVNELALLCEKLTIDIEDVITGFSSDRRIGKEFLKPGPGYGGSCFPKDADALIATSEKSKTPLQVVKAAVASNRLHKHKMVEKISSLFCAATPPITLAFWGVTYKAETDDMRNAPSLDIIPALQELGVQVRIFDPGIKQPSHHLFNNVVWCDSPEEAAKNAHGIVVLTDWPVLQDVSWQALGKVMQDRVVMDLRNMYRAKPIKAAGFRYYGLGRGFLETS